MLVSHHRYKMCVMMFTRGKTTSLLHSLQEMKVLQCLPCWGEGRLLPPSAPLWWRGFHSSSPCTRASHFITFYQSNERESRGQDKKKVVSATMLITIDHAGKDNALVALTWLNSATFCHLRFISSEVFAPRPHVPFGQSKQPSNDNLQQGSNRMVLLVCSCLDNDW